MWTAVSSTYWHSSENRQNVSDGMKYQLHQYGAKMKYQLYQYGAKMKYQLYQYGAKMLEANCMNENLFGESNSYLDSPEFPRALSKESANYAVHQSQNLASVMRQVKSTTKYKCCKYSLLYLQVL